MKIEETRVQAVTSEEFKTTAFRVDQKMAQLLFRDKLYTAEGRLRVIPQEYMANARDAHRAAGKSDTPIDVTLPTQMNPELIVRDYGNGIPEQIVDDIFVVYGASTKDKSQLENGGYGIGAKSAFSYVNAFSVTTTVQGVRYIYAASIDSGGMNQFTLMDKGPATGSDGTEIRVPIRNNDIMTLKTWIAEITHGWTPRPNFVGGTPLPYNERKPQQSGAGWDFYDKNESPFSYRGFSPGITVTADDIPYVITPEQAKAIGGTTHKLHDLLCGARRQLVMHFKVGELYIPPQRESVDMTTKSCTAISKTADSFIKAMLDSAQARLQKAATALEKVALVLDEDFDMQVSRELNLPISVDMKLLNKDIDLDDPNAPAGFRVYDARWSRMFRDFELQDGVMVKELLKPSAPQCNRVLVDMLGRKMSACDLKRLIRSKHLRMDWGQVHVVAVYDKAAFEQSVGVSLDIVARLGKYELCARDPTIVRERTGESGHLFVRHQHVEYNAYNDAVSVSLQRSKKDNLSKFWVYVDASPTYGALYHGKPITDDELGQLALLLHLLKHRELGHEEVHLWEERYERRGSPSEFTFLEDAIQEAAEDVITKDRHTLALLAFEGVLPYVPSKDWPCTSYRDDYVVDAFTRSGVFSPSFLSMLGTVMKLERKSDDEEDAKTRVFTKKLWDLLEREVGTDLTTACKDAATHIYAVRDEFLHFAYGFPRNAMMVADAAHERYTKLRVDSKDVTVRWTEILTETLKTYTPKNTLFRKSTNP